MRLPTGGGGASSRYTGHRRADRARCAGRVIGPDGSATPVHRARGGSVVCTHTLHVCVRYRRRPGRPDVARVRRVNIKQQSGTLPMYAQVVGRGEAVMDRLSDDRAAVVLICEMRSR